LHETVKNHAISDNNLISVAITADSYNKKKQKLVQIHNNITPQLGHLVPCWNQPKVFSTRYITWKLVYCCCVYIYWSLYHHHHQFSHKSIQQN